MGLVGETIEQTKQLAQQIGARAKESLKEQLPPKEALDMATSSAVAKTIGQNIDNSDRNAEDEAQAQEINFNDYILPSPSNASSGSLNAPNGGSNNADRSTPVTGAKDLDQRIANKNLTMFDYYMAKKYMGIDLNAHINGTLNLNQNIQTRIANRTKATADIYETLKAIDMGNEIITKAQDNSGVFNGVSRFLNQKTGGIWGIRPELAQTDNLVKAYSFSLGKAMGQGKLTNEQLKKAEEASDFKLRSRQENTNRMAQNQQTQLIYLENQMNNLKALGAAVPMDVVAKYLETQAKIAYINRKQGKINLKDYQRIGVAFKTLTGGQR